MVESLSASYAAITYWTGQYAIQSAELKKALAERDRYKVVLLNTKTALLRVPDESTVAAWVPRALPIVEAIDAALTEGEQ